MTTNLFSVMALAFSCTLAGACQGEEPDQEANIAKDWVAGDVATLYRNSNIVTELRLHFSTFDAKGERPGFNLSNCEMVARTLNANYREMANLGPDASTGFWCEEGEYRIKGAVPSNFDSEFPTGVRENAAP